MSDKKDKSIVEIFVDVVVEHVMKDIVEVLKLLPECTGDDIHEVIENVFKGDDDE